MEASEGKDPSVQEMSVVKSEKEAIEFTKNEPEMGETLVQSQKGSEKPPSSGSAVKKAAKPKPKEKKPTK